MEFGEVGWGCVLRGAHTPATQSDPKAPPAPLKKLKYCIPNLLKEKNCQPPSSTSLKIPDGSPLAKNPIPGMSIAS